MTDPLSFTSLSPRFALPFLFAGQAQKEFFVNEAHARIDMLLHCAVSGEASAPPIDPIEGECWLVGAAATGEWAGHESSIACYQAGSWLLAAPVAGMRIFDIAAGQSALFDGSWQRPETPPAPEGGATADLEARGAIATLIEALKNAGIFAP